MIKFLVVGLGNIGQEYAHTRHNIGFDVVDYFVQKHQAISTLERLAFVSRIKIKNTSIVCIKPTTYMNLSGRAVKYWMEKEKIAIENVLVVVDDLALPIEKIRLRAQGTHAGHNGLKDIELMLGTSAYAKLRFGIGNVFPKGRQIDFVLGRWTENELPIVRQKIVASADIIEVFALQGVNAAMNQINSLDFGG